MHEVQKKVDQNQNMIEPSTQNEQKPAEVISGTRSQNIAAEMVSVGLNAQSGEFFQQDVQVDFAFLFASPRYLRIQNPVYEEDYGEISYD